MKWLVTAGVLLLAAGCSSSGSPAVPPRVTVTVTASPSVSFDADGRSACQQAAQDAWLLALGLAKRSMVRDLQDLALREEQLGNHDLIKVWCAEHYRG